MATGVVSAPKLAESIRVNILTKIIRLTLRYEFHRYSIIVTKSKEFDSNTPNGHHVLFLRLNYELWIRIELLKIWLNISMDWTFLAASAVNCWFVSHSAYVTCSAQDLFHEWLVFCVTMLNHWIFSNGNFSLCSSNPFFSDAQNKETPQNKKKKKNVEHTRINKLNIHGKFVVSIAKETPFFRLLFSLVLPIPIPIDNLID